MIVKSPEAARGNLKLKMHSLETGQGVSTTIAKISPTTEKNWLKLNENATLNLAANAPPTSRSILAKFFGAVASSEHFAMAPTVSFRDAKKISLDGVAIYAKKDIDVDRSGKWPLALTT